MPQRLMVALYDIGLPTINHHIKQVYADGEQLEEATIRYFRIVQQEGTRQVTRQVAHYNLKMIIAVGFKVNSPRAVQFRKWANAIIQDFTVKGWAMDEERLKSGGSRLTEKPRHAPPLAFTDYRWSIEALRLCAFSPNLPPPSRPIDKTLDALWTRVLNP